MKKNYLLLMFCFVLNYSFAQIIDPAVSLVANINPDAPDDVNNSSPANLTYFNGEIFFRANDGVNGLELWKVDSNLQASLIEDIRPGSSSSSPNNFIVFNNKLYFTAINENVSGVDLFSTDGTSVTDESLYDTSFSGLFNPIELNGKLYYTGFNSSVEPNKLVEFDGITGNEVPDTGAGEESVLGGNTIAFNDKILLYMNYSTDDDAVGTELYEYDPDAQTFTLIKDIDAGSGNSSISNFVQIGSEVYFEAESEVWKTDGTTDGTVLVTSIGNESIGSVRNFFVWNDELYFEGDNGTDDDELYKYTPASDTVIALSNIAGANDNHDPDDFIIVNDPALSAETLFYSGEPDTDNDARLYSTDGSSITQLTEDFVDVSELAYFPDNNNILFRADVLDDNGDETLGSELYAYDLNTLSVSSFNFGEVKIYPNPATDRIFVKSTENIGSYDIFNLQGQKVQSGKLNNDAIDINLSTGIYILNLTNTSQNKQIKFIVK